MCSGHTDFEIVVLYLIGKLFLIMDLNNGGGKEMNSVSAKH